MEEGKKLEGGVKKQAKKVNLDEITNDSDQYILFVLLYNLTF